MEEGEASSLELTSQGAGTYWYLPPECFQVGLFGAPQHVSQLPLACRQHKQQASTPNASQTWPGPIVAG